MDNNMNYIGVPYLVYYRSLCILVTHFYIVLDIELPPSVEV